MIEYSRLCLADVSKLLLLKPHILTSRTPPCAPRASSPRHTAVMAHGPHLAHMKVCEREAAHERCIGRGRHQTPHPPPRGTAQPTPQSRRSKASRVARRRRAVGRCVKEPIGEAAGLGDSCYRATPDPAERDSDWSRFGSWRPAIEMRIIGWIAQHGASAASASCSATALDEYGSTSTRFLL